MYIYIYTCIYIYIYVLGERSPPARQRAARMPTTLGTNKLKNTQIRTYIYMYKYLYFVCIYICNEKNVNANHPPKKKRRGTPAKIKSPATCWRLG